MRSRFFLFALIALLWPALSGRAEEVSATATLLQETTSVGDPVELQIKVTGSQRASQLQRGVDGLEITYEGSSTQVQLNNFVLSTSVVQTYSVKPLRAGKFVIPGEVIDTGGTKVATNSVKLTVTQGDSGKTAASSGQLAFSELVVSKQSAYVGEMVPVELRIYVDARVRWNFQDPPEFGSAGFTTEKMPQPVQSEVRRNGRPYELVVFKTAISPVKAGKLTFGPATLTCQAQIPQQRAAIPHFGMDPSMDDMFNNPFGMFSAPQDMTIKSDSVEIEAKPLPPGQPKSFSGAVGAFTLSTDAYPTTVRVGDPITLSAAVAGWGNLDGVGAPSLTEEDGWRVYPPASKIKAGDDVRIHGTKTFEFQMVPLENKKSLPGIEFSYFDPVRRKIRHPGRQGDPGVGFRCERRAGSCGGGGQSCRPGRTAAARERHSLYPHGSRRLEQIVSTAVCRPRFLGGAVGAPRRPRWACRFPQASGKGSHREGAATRGVPPGKAGALEDAPARRRAVRGFRGCGREVHPDRYRFCNGRESGAGRCGFRLRLQTCDPIRRHRHQEHLRGPGSAVLRRGIGGEREGDAGKEDRGSRGVEGVRSWDGLGSLV